MSASDPGMAQQIARATVAFEQHRTGHAPRSVTVVLGNETVVVTLEGALSPAELALSRTADGAAQVQELHRRIFLAAAGPLRDEIQRITGAGVREAAVEVEPGTAAVVQVFPSGTTVQVFLLGGSVAADCWSGTDPGGPA
ncbi:MAG TPA: Na-translocating system protein MpsC family protein [Gemmataceae bacterium]|nr:Na-translocating system protein MpsC family protein [Gemmataceae bacterium]